MANPSLTDALKAASEEIEAAIPEPEPIASTASPLEAADPAEREVADVSVEVFRDMIRVYKNLLRSSV